MKVVGFAMRISVETLARFKIPLSVVRNQSHPACSAGHDLRAVEGEGGRSQGEGEAQSHQPYKSFVQQSHFSPIFKS